MYLPGKNSHEIQMEFNGILWIFPSKILQYYKVLVSIFENHFSCCKLRLFYSGFRAYGFHPVEVRNHSFGSVRYRFSASLVELIGLQIDLRSTSLLKLEAHLIGLTPLKDAEYLSMTGWCSFNHFTWGSKIAGEKSLLPGLGLFSAQFQWS